ncbi:hypothetical protein M3Y94_01248800 [Aphelenchoides besseyi]|nr:hypothetical protein M3Y94_01248800 [Aphelenchoides besseyi]KAI6219387.1 hypothetical protein M3Y95_01105800 [Aphelenchoides besseyi]
MFFFSGGSPAAMESEYGQVDQYDWKDTFEQLTSSLGIITLSVFGQFVGLAYLSIGTIASFEGDGIVWKALAFACHLCAFVLLLVRINWFTIGLIPSKWKSKTIALAMLGSVLLMTVLTIVLEFIAVASDKSDARVYRPNYGLSMTALFWLAVAFVLDLIYN